MLGAYLATITACVMRLFGYLVLANVKLERSVATTVGLRYKLQVSRKQLSVICLGNPKLTGGSITEIEPRRR
jgi:hypothetical protein